MRARESEPAVRVSQGPQGPSKLTANKQLTTAGKRRGFLEGGWAPVGLAMAG